MIKYDMPVLRPIPIDTYGCGKLIQLKKWIITVRQWEVVSDWEFVLPNEMKIIIPAGFVFDGASIPKVLWGILSPTGILLIPSILHDYAYRYGYLWAVDNKGFMSQYGRLIERAGWDKLFFEVCKHVNGMKEVSWSAWLMLKLFGWVAWNVNVKLRGGPY